MRRSGGGAPFALSALHAGGEVRRNAPTGGEVRSTGGTKQGTKHRRNVRSTGGMYEAPEVRSTGGMYEAPEGRYEAPEVRPEVRPPIVW